MDQIQQEKREDTMDQGIDNKDDNLIVIPQQGILTKEEIDSYNNSTELKILKVWVCGWIVIAVTMLCVIILL